REVGRPTPDRGASRLDDQERVRGSVADGPERNSRSLAREQRTGIDDDLICRESLSHGNGLARASEHFWHPVGQRLVIRAIPGLVEVKLLVQGFFFEVGKYENAPAQ